MDKSYIAGVFESSGSITFKKDSRTKNSVYPVIVIKSQNLELLKTLKKIYGGSIKKSKTTGKIMFSHKKVLNFIKDIYGYLNFKKEVADLIVEFYEVRFTKDYEVKRKKEIVEKFINIEGWHEGSYKTGKSSIKKWMQEVK
jgi:hypothetical protein